VHPEYQSLRLGKPCVDKYLGEIGRSRAGQEVKMSAQQSQPTLGTRAGRGK